MYPPIAGFYDRFTAGALVRAAAAAYGDASGMAAWGEEHDCGACHIVENDRTDTLAFVTANCQRTYHCPTVTCAGGTVDGFDPVEIEPPGTPGESAAIYPNCTC